MKKNLFKLENVIQNYAWGSQSALTELFGIENPTSQPQAELWMGAHPNGCSRLVGSELTLAQLIEQSPTHALGNYTDLRFGQLPFLFKVLAAAKPLSVQVHPKLSKAKIGFEKENRVGLALNDSARNYKDGNHKPELVYALTFYKAMNGFRSVEDIISLFEQAKITVLKQALEQLKASANGQGLKSFFAQVMSLEGEDKSLALKQLNQAISEPCRTLKAREAFELIREFAIEFSDDVGLFSPLMLNIVELEPGEAMFLHAETPHAYVQGVGLELMANSDNVLRAGLTPKHMDLPELMDNTRFEATDLEQIRLSPIVKEHKVGFPIPVEDFNFELITINGEALAEFVRGPEILFCLEGTLQISSTDEMVTLQKGESVFVCSGAKQYQISGNGRIAKAFN
ncbi:Mannose-6-phosphate isomerase [Vibrio owensii]|uniref:mannose-6-phosphate isomerase, class I n=1 Tax=Vibrio owensii TaxID=696485 RepID=UPI0028949E62|nr:Mannose-6-phosphate isomerase [Vibrio owensii]